MNKHLLNSMLVFVAACLAIPTTAAGETGTEATVSVDYLSLEEGRVAITDETCEPYFSRLERREMAALTGKPDNAEETLTTRRNRTREQFQDAVRRFSADEQQAVSWFATTISGLLHEEYPLFARLPWRFIKSANHLCGGFSYTRGDCIVYSQATVERVVAAYQLEDKQKGLRTMGPLFLHEKMHVLQRLYPERFAAFYADELGLVRGTVEDHAWLRERQMLNPDALRMEWLVPSDEAGEQRYYWVRTILDGERRVPVMGRDFRDIAIRVQPSGDPGNYRVATNPQGQLEYRDVKQFTDYLERMPIRRGLDHPNELTAYLFQQVAAADHFQQQDETPAPVGAAQHHPLRVQFRAWCREQLR